MKHIVCLCLTFLISLGVFAADSPDAKALQGSWILVKRRMSDEICRKHQVRPHVIAEINAIETLLRSLGPSQAGALMPKIALRGRENLKLRAIRLRGRNLGLDIGLLRLSDSAANTAVAAFTSLAKATVPKLVKR